MRFHMGFSFRLRDLKKFLFPILIGILAYFGFGALFGCLQVHALVDMTSNYYFNNIEDFYSDIDTNKYGNVTIHEFLDKLISDYNSSNSSYELLITPVSSSGVMINPPSGSISIALVNPTNTTLYNKLQNPSLWGLNYTSNGINYGTFGNNNTMYQSPVLRINLNGSNGNIYNSTSYQAFYNCMVGNGCSNQEIYDSNTQTTYRGNNYSSFDIIFLRGYNTGNIDNYEDFTFNNSYLYYYSSFDIQYRVDFVGTNPYKPLNYLGYTFNPFDYLMSYYDYLKYDYLNYSDGLNEFYIGGINPSDLSNYRLDFSFTYSDSDYPSSLRYLTYLFGRKDNSTFYSYEYLENCRIQYSSSYGGDSNKYNGSIFFNDFNTSCNINVNDYDKFYIYVQPLSSLNTGRGIKSIKYSYNFGYFKDVKGGSLTNGYNIYEKYSNLDNDFSIMLSSNSNQAYFRYDSNNEMTVAISVDRDNNSLSQTSMNFANISSQFNINYLIFNYPSSNNDSTNLDLFINENVIVSFKEVVNNEDTYTYYDSSNQLVTDSVDNTIIINFNKSYDKSYYFGIVNNYIDDLTSSVYSFSVLTQTFYDSMPSSFQILIFVLFIMFCLYFTYLIIRK